MSASTSPLATRTAGVAARPPGPAIWAAIRVMWQARRTRTQLSELDAHLLRDIGISPSEALREADRAPWDLAGRR